MDILIGKSSMAYQVSWNAQTARLKVLAESTINPDD